MLSTSKTAAHNAIINDKQETCHCLQFMAWHGYMLDMVRNLQKAHRTMLKARLPALAAGAASWRSGVSGLPGCGSFAVARVRGLAAASPIEISGGIQNGLG
jgi:hypothetical protein